MNELHNRQKVVLDTNILVSSLLSDGPPARIIDWIADGKLFSVYNGPVLAEYWDVLSLPKFGFSFLQINRLIQGIVRTGFGVSEGIASTVKLPDESDRKFYDAAKNAGAVLITGNSKHYPREPFIVTPSVFMERFGE
jgi:putative PIN family toxin of toxin-antitoxin system